MLHFKKCMFVLCIWYVQHSFGSPMIDSDNQPPMFDHTSMSLHLHTNGSDVDYAIYTCMPEYEMKGPADTVYAMFDTSTRRWNFSATPECQGISCPQPASPANGYVSFSDDDADVNESSNSGGDGTSGHGGGDYLGAIDGIGGSDGGSQVYPVGSQGVYTCNDGHQLVGSATTTCDMDGSWSSVPPTCQEYCPQTSNTSTAANFTRGRCFDVASTEMTWLDASDACASLNGSLAIIDRNETLEFLRNTLSNVNDAYAGDYWIGGYLKQQEYSWKWHASGDLITNYFWAESEPTSGEKDTRILLSKPSGFEWTAYGYDQNRDDNDEGNGYVCQFNSSCTEANMNTGAEHDYNGACYYFQNEGFFTWDSANRVDGDSGKAGCPGLGNRRGFLAEIRDQDTQDAIVSKIQTLGTSRSYWIGAERMESSDEQMWLWVDGSTIIDAWWGPGEPIFNATCISLSLFGDNYLMNGDDCSNRHRFLCQFDSVNISVQCGDPGTPYHGTRATNAFTFIPGDEVEFSCNPGYDIVGSSVLHCGNDGEWNTSLPSCQARKCRSPPDVPNTFIIYQSSPEYRGTIIYQCFEDYYSIGQQYIYCQENGNWTPAKFECEANPADPECKEWSGLLLAIGISTAILFTYSVAMTVAYISVHRRKLDEQPSEKREECLDPNVPTPETSTGSDQLNHAYQELQTGNMDNFPPNPHNHPHSHTLPYAGSHSYANSGPTAPSSVSYTNQRILDQTVRMTKACRNDVEDDYVVLPE